MGWGVLLAATLFAPSADSSLVVSTSWLAAHLRDRGVVVVQVDVSDSAYRTGHIPGARFIRYGSYIAESGGNSTELPPADSMRRLFEAAGISNDSRVVLVGGPLIVSRAFFTLDFLGLTNVSVLDGGMTGWRSSGAPVEQSVPAEVRGRITTTTRPSVVATADWVSAHLGKQGMALIDTRREDEYAGTAAGVEGHLPGAKRLEWQELFRDPAEFTLKDVSELRRLWRDRVAPGDTVVAYCRVGHRSSATYLVSRLLGYPVKLYDGSYEEWSRLKLPLVKGDAAR